MNPLSLIEKYYLKGTDLYHLLLLHSRQVQNKALEVAFHHPELNIDTVFMSEAALLHDIGIFRCYAPDIFCFGEYKYIEHGYLGADLLRIEGLERHALVCERHTGTGLSLDMIITKNLPLPHREMIPVSIEEQVICYADKFYSKSQPNGEIPLADIRKSLSNFGLQQVNKFDEWHSLFEY